MTEEEALRVLQLPDTCTPHQVRQAFRDLVKVWHPDRFGADRELQAKAERQLQEVNQAYAILRLRPHRSRAKHQPPSPPRPAAPAARGSRPRTVPALPLTRLIGGGVALGLASVAVAVFVGWSVSLRRSPSDPRTGTPANIEDPKPPGAPAVRRGTVRHYVRPESGLDLITPESAGGGSLVLRNSGRRDALVVLSEGGVHRRATYVRIGEQVQLVDVAPGVYRVSIASGQNWDGTQFTADTAYEELTYPVQFAEREQGGMVERTRLTITVASMVQNMAGIRTAAPFHIEPR